MLDKDDWFNVVAIVRGGAWHKLIERLAGKDKTNGSVDPEELRHSALRAAVGGMAFTGCGGTIDMKSLLEGPSSTFIDRVFEVATLMNTKSGRGHCAACGKKSDLFGCGVFCGGCNRAWCVEYVLTGMQLEAYKIRCRIKRARHRRYARAA
jgi:hypothetical protein